MSHFDSWYDYFNPLNYFRTIYDNIHTDGYNLGDISAGLFGIDRTSATSGNSLAAQNIVDSQEILGQVVNDSRAEYLADREHEEMREDTAYQRGVADMKKAGLNPYTIGASPSSSSPSRVGENTIASKVQLLGYLLDLKNLDFKNKALANKTITDLMKTIA